MHALPVWKRAIDLAGCIVALPLLALCTLAMAVVTQCVSPGPVFFRRERIGPGGRRFKLYKFRSMHVSADPGVHQAHGKKLIGANAPMLKLDASRDARLVPGTWLLRASGLDELPQLINVLRGEISLVGPRPCPSYKFAQYQPSQKQRCQTVPGLAGLWQVSGQNRTAFAEMIAFDLRHIRDFSQGLDWQIILRTIPVPLRVILPDRRSRRAILGVPGLRGAVLRRRDR